MWWKMVITALWRYGYKASSLAPGHVGVLQTDNNKTFVAILI